MRSNSKTNFRFEFEVLIWKKRVNNSNYNNACFVLDDGDEGLAAYVEPFVILLILVINGCVAIW